MKKVTLLVASVLCSFGAFAQSSIEQLPTEIGKTTYQLVTPRGTLYYDKTIEESYLTSNCMTGRNQNDVISLDDERGQFLVIPAENNNAFYLYSVEAKKFVCHEGQYKAGLTDEPTELAMWAHGATEMGRQAYNQAQFSYADYPFTIADEYVEGVTVADGKHLNSINVCCWDTPANPDYRWCDTSHLDDGNAFMFVVAGEVSDEVYNNVREALGLGTEVVEPEDPTYNTTTKYFTAPELRAEADATGKALIAINSVTTTADKYITGEPAIEHVSADGTLASARAPYESEVLEMIPTDGGYILRHADAEGDEGYIGLSGNNFTITASASAVVWTVLGPGEEGYGNVTGFDDLYSDIDHSLNDNMVRFIYNGNQYMNAQSYNNTSGVRGGTGAWSFNYIYNANYGKTVEPVDPVDPVDPEPPVVEPDGATMSITAVFPNGNEHVVYAYEGKLTASATVPEGAISNFEIVSNEGDVYVLKAGDQFLHWTSGDDKNKSADLDGLNEEFDEAINYLTIKLGDETGLQGTTWDKAPIASLYEVIGNGTNGQAFNYTLRENDDAWIAGDSGMKFYDTNWDGNGCRTSYFRVEVSEVTPVDPEPPVVEGPQAAFTLTNLSSSATDYSLPIEVPAEFAAPVLEAKATTTVIEFTKTAGVKAAFVASTDGGNNFYSNITLQDNRLGFDYMMDNGQEGWFTKTKSPYTDLDTAVRVAFTQNEETGLLNWYDAETGELINSTNVSTNAAWGTRTFGTNGYSHLYVGGYRDAAGAAKYVFPGEIASVRVYAQELTTDELTSLSWEGLEDSFEYVPDYDYNAAVAPVLAEANAALEGHDNVWVTTVGDKLITRNDQFSSPHSDRAEGSTNNLLDGANNTFWHSDWHAGNQPAHSHYLQVALDEAIDGDVLLTFVRRNAANDQVTLLDVETSMDGENFAHAAYIDMPNSGAGKTEQKVFALEEKAKFLRFWADATTSNRGYWHVGDFQLQTVETNLNIDAPDYAYPTAVAALQEAIAATPAVDGTKEDVEALAAAVEAYKAALAGYPEFTEWTGDVQINAGNVTSIDDLLNVDFCFNRALSTETSAYGVLGVVYDHTGDAYALAFDALFGGVEVEKVKADGFVGNVAHVQFEKIADLANGLQDKAKGIAAKIGGFETAEGHALVVLAGKSFLVDGEKYNAIVKADYELTTGTITGIENLLVNSKGEIFDLQGRRVNNAQNGLFIQNGKKVLR